MNRFIDPALRTRIDAELNAIEQQESVRILLAVESGSRAWGFPSQDSDYDVRFLYVRPIETYLAVMPRRDVLERPVDAVLDINGWDLRKALQLMLRSNAVLIEWLTSPIRYRDWDQSSDLLALVRSAASLTALGYHYLHQARRSFDATGDGRDTTRLKSYCYALRSALAIIWIRQHGEAPPMDIGTLVANLTLPGDLVAQIHHLIAVKVVATEDASIHRSPLLDALIASALSMPVPEATAVNRKEITRRADALLAALLLDRAGPTAVQKADSTCS